jgi:hypothetical protein
MLLINAAFVGGYGAARKTYSLVQNLKELNIDYVLSTDSVFLPKLKVFGLEPDIVIPWNESHEQRYQSVEETLRSVSYSVMISLGWRTFVPYDAVQRDIPAAIIDGGWPEVLQPWPGEFCHEIYKSLKAYCLTCHFPGPDDLLPTESGINFEWISQPFGAKEIQWHQDLTLATKRDQRSSLGIPELEELGTNKLIFLNMAPDYLDPWQISWLGGWMTAAQTDECRGFVTRLLVELDNAGGYTLFMLEQLEQEMLPVLERCKLGVITRDFLDPTTHHLLRCASDVVLCRAIRDVSSAQLALSGHPCVLHTICPAREGYMGEWESALYAQEIGIAKSIPHESVSLAEAIKEWMDSPEAKQVSKNAATVAAEFSQKKGITHIFELLGY